MSRGLRTRIYRERGARMFRKRVWGYGDRWHLIVSEVGTRISRGVRMRTYRERRARTFRERARGYRDG